MHRTLTLLLLAAFFAASAGRAGAAPSTPPKPPNILFIFADDHAQQAISAYNFRGLNLNQTPNIDRLAKEGVIFRSSFCGNSICSPSRATILTGQHSHLNGVTAWQSFDANRWTFVKQLQVGGYTTAIFGKWHLTSTPAGFDEWMVHPGQGSYYNPVFITPGGNKTIEGYATDVTTDLALDFIKRSSGGGKPFLLMCQYKAPHRTWEPGPDSLREYTGTEFPEPPSLFDDYSGRAGPAAKNKMEIGRHMKLGYDLSVPLEETYEWKRFTPEQKKGFVEAFHIENENLSANAPSGEEMVRWKYQRYLRNYLRCVHDIDRNVGRILAFLKENGLEENTLVVYSSDQGFYLGEHGWFDKRWMYEESFRMPLLMRWPGVIQPGTEVAQLVQNIDYAPTFLDAAGMKAPESVQGRSLLPLMRGESPAWRDALYYHYYDGPGEHGVAKHYGIRTARHKLIRFYADADDTWELFDLEKDPMEMKSVYDEPEYAEIRETLKRKLDELKEQYRNPIHTEADEKDCLRPTPETPEPET